MVPELSADKRLRGLQDHRDIRDGRLIETLKRTRAYDYTRSSKARKTMQDIEEAYEDLAGHTIENQRHGEMHEITGEHQERESEDYQTVDPLIIETSPSSSNAESRDSEAMQE
jgi:hypothetical protein